MSLFHQLTLRAVLAAMSLDERDGLRAMSAGRRPSDRVLALLERRQLVRRLPPASGGALVLSRLGGAVADALARPEEVPPGR